MRAWGLHLVLLLIELALLLGGRVLVLLVLRDEIVHVGLGLSELHLVHALPSVPVEESLGKIYLRKVQSGFLKNVSNLSLEHGAELV